jgi:hypothetical protein
MRVKKPEVVFKAVRLLLNRHSDEIIEQVLAKALTGDSLALLAASYLIMEANKAMGGQDEATANHTKWKQAMLRGEYSHEEIVAFQEVWNKLRGEAAPAE